MKSKVAGLCIVALLGLALSPLLAVAERPKTTAATYDISKEVTVAGKVSKVLVSPEPGMMSGAHLLLTVGPASVDACLGRFALVGKDALRVEEGREIVITGILKTVNEKQVMLARTVKVDGRTYVIRNERGVPVSPQFRQRMAQGGEVQ